MLIYIHIGTHKTASTSIQSFLGQNASVLAQGGIYLPKTGTFDWKDCPGHYNLAWELYGDPRYDSSRGGIRELVNELRQSELPYAVISAEDLEFLVDLPDKLAYFEKTLIDAGHRIRYIMFVRRVDDYAESLFGQSYREGNKVRYDDYVLKILLTGKYGKCYFDYREFARKWAQAAREPLFIYSFDEAAAGLGIVPFFLKLINAPAELIKSARKLPALNTRFVPKVAFYHRRVFRLLLRVRFMGGIKACCRGNL